MRFTAGTSEYHLADATDSDAIAALMGGRKASAMVTSPPYCVALDYGDEVDDECDPYTLAKDTITAWLPHMEDHAMVVWNIGTMRKARPDASLRGLVDAGLSYWHTVVWQKVGVPSPRYPADPRVRVYRPHATYEFVFFLAVGEPAGPPMGQRHKDALSTDVWRMNQTGANAWQQRDAGSRRLARGDEGHGHREDLAFVGTMPLPVASRMIVATTARDELVVDPFCGSGTTAVAARILGRPCVTTELSTENLSVAHERATYESDRLDLSPPGDLAT